MERAPRITSVFESEELRQRERIRRAAQQRGAEARKKVVTGLALVRMLFQLALVPNRQVKQQGNVIRQNIGAAKEARRVVSGDRDRMLAFGSRILASR